MYKLKFKSKNLNELLDGGLESGVITNVYGGPGAGKTNFVLEAVVATLKEKKKVVFIDTEGSFSVERFKQLASESKLEDVILIEPKTLRNQLDVIKKLEKLVEKENVGLVVIDSLVSLYRLHMQDGTFSDANYILGSILSLLSSIIRRKDIPAIVTNQVYTDFGTGELELVGRDIPKYYCKCLILMEKIGMGKRKITLIKHRSRPENVSTIVQIKNEGLADI